MATPAVAAQGQRLIDHCMKTLADGESFGDRMGAAFGLAAMVKGLRLPSLKKVGKHPPLPSVHAGC
jgi:hypothetical protein